MTENPGSRCESSGSGPTDVPAPATRTDAARNGHPGEPRRALGLGSRVLVAGVLLVLLLSTMAGVGLGANPGNVGAPSHLTQARWGSTGSGAGPGSTFPATTVGPAHSLAECAQQHPSMTYPLRIRELSMNLYCSFAFGLPEPPGGALSPTPSAGTPSAPTFGMYNMQLTYDSYDHYLLLFGATGTGTLNGTETWEFSSGAWTELSPKTSPESCVGSVMSYDPWDQYVVYLAGGDFGAASSCTSAGQTWEYRGGDWTNVTPATSPPPRQAAVFTNDSADGYMLLFGGACVLSSVQTLCGDTWSFKGGVWTNRTNTVHPSARAGAGMAYDAADGYVVLFGGAYYPAEGDFPYMLADTWKYSAGTWSQIGSCGGPDQPQCGSNVPPEPWPDGMTYDAAAQAIFYTCARENYSSGGPENYYEFSNGNWINLNSWAYGSYIPAGRLAEGLAYDWADGYSVMFGGVTMNWHILNDTWVFQDGSWSNVTGTGGYHVVASIAVGSRPESLAVNPTNGYVYVVNVGRSGDGNVSVLNGTASIGSVTVGQDPANGTFDPGRQTDYVPNVGSDNVSLLHGTTASGQVRVGTFPVAAVYDSRNGYVYVMNEGSGNVSVIRNATVVGSPSVGGAPVSATVDGATGYVYIPGSDSVSVINGTTVIGAVKTGSVPVAGAYDPRNGYVYIPNWASDNVSVINGTTLVASVNVGTAPFSATYDGANGCVDVLNSNSGNVSVVCGTSVVATVGLGSNSGPWNATFDSANGLLYVVNMGSGSTDSNVSLVRNTSFVGSVNVGVEPTGAVYDRYNGLVYVANTGSNNVSVISNGGAGTVTFTESGLPSGDVWTVTMDGLLWASDTTTIRITLAGGTYPYSVATIDGYTPTPSSGSLDLDGSNLAVSVTFSQGGQGNQGPPYALTFTQTGQPPGLDWDVGLGSTPSGGTIHYSTNSTLVFDEANGTYYYSVGGTGAYAANPSSGAVVVDGAPKDVAITFSTGAGSFTSTPVAVGNGPMTSAFDSLNGLVYAPNNLSGNVSVINGTHVVASVDVGTNPGFAAFDSSDGDVYVLNAGSDTVSVIDGSTVIATISVGSHPRSAVFDASTGDLYVLNFASANVSVIRGTSLLTTIAVGDWPSAGVLDSANGDLYVANYASENVTLIHSTTVVGSVALLGQPWSAAYDSDNGFVYLADAGYANVTVVNGTKIVATLHPAGQGDNMVFYDGSDGYVYLVSPGVYNVSVIDGVTIVGSVELGTSGESAVYDGPNGYLYVVGGGRVQVLEGTDIVGWTNVGTYSTSSTLDSWDGDVYVSNTGSSNVSVIAQTPASPPYEVTFLENGLGSGASWDVTFNGTTTTASANSSTIVFPGVVNGTYSYSVGSEPGYSASPSSGSLKVSGRGVFRTITWTARTLYLLAFVESGLPSGASWTVNLSGNAQSTTGSRLAFTEPNGSYDYTISTVSGVSVNGSASGTVTVQGLNVSVVVTFQAGTSSLFTLAFQSSGLPDGANWSVGLLGPDLSGGVTRWSEGAGTISFLVSKGLYTYSASAPGYRVDSGSVDVTGVDTTTTVKLPFLPSSPSPSNATASAVPTWAVGIGVGFVLVGAIGIGATFYRIRSRRREQGKELVGNLLDRAGEFEEGEIIAPGGDPRPPSWNPREPR